MFLAYCIYAVYTNHNIIICNLHAVHTGTIEIRIVKPG